MEILKNPPVGRPVIAGFNWILTPAFIFVGHFLNKLYGKFDNILTDSLSLIRVLEITKFSDKYFMFFVSKSGPTIDVKYWIEQFNVWRNGNLGQELNVCVWAFIKVQDFTNVANFLFNCINSQKKSSCTY